MAADCEAIMSRSAAYCFVRDVPDAELRECYTEAVAALLRLVDDADVMLPQMTINVVAACESAVSEALDDLRDERSAAEADKEEAEARLEEKMSEEDDGETKTEQLRRAERRIEELTARNSTLERQLAAQECLAFDLRHAVGDVLAMSRKLVSKCEAAGIHPTHVRAVPGGRKRRVAPRSST